jgi:hypothetical protein
LPAANKQVLTQPPNQIYSNFNSYTVPGPAVFSCNGGGSNPNPNPTTATPAPTTMVTSQKPVDPTPTPGGCTVAQWYV